MSIETLNRRIRNCLINAKFNKADPALRRQDVEQALYYRRLRRSTQA